MIRSGYPLGIEADSLRFNVVVWHRVYAVTGKSKLLCAPLALLILAQFTCGIFFAHLLLSLPRKFFGACSLVHEFISL